MEATEEGAQKQEGEGRVGVITIPLSPQKEWVECSRMGACVAVEVARNFYISRNFHCKLCLRCRG